MRPPPTLASDLFERTGVAVRFYRPDGVPASAGAEGGAAGGNPADGLARLAAAAAEAADDRVEDGPEGARAAWPIRVRGRTVLVAAAEVPAAGDARARRMLVAALGEAVRARLAEARARTEGDAACQSLAQSFDEVCLLHSIAEVLRVNRPAEELLEYVCRELRATVGAEAAVACLPVSEEGGPRGIVAGRLPFPAPALSRVVEHLLDAVGPGQLVLINNHCQEDPALASLAPGLARAVLVPLDLWQGERGALALFNRAGEEFGSPDAKLIQSTTSASGIFIENRRLYQELHDLMLDLVRALVSSVDAKDPYTCGHSERVAIVCREIARHLGLDETAAEQAYLAGLLHDIGKIGTPEHILQKKGRLDDDERVIMNRHTEVGGRILGALHRLEPVREAVLYHHERMDGAGYPRGLKGEAIPRLARIVGLADAFDAMTSNRPYRPMLSLDHVRREIQRNAGTQFDPEVVAALVQMDLDRLMQKFLDRPATVGG